MPMAASDCLTHPFGSVLDADGTVLYNIVGPCCRFDAPCCTVNFELKEGLTDNVVGQLQKMVRHTATACLEQCASAGGGFGRFGVVDFRSANFSQPRKQLYGE